MKQGILYVIATPIGNLEDFTFRALRILREETAAVFCEDTRQTKKLLSHYKIDLPAYPIHSHSRDGAINGAIALLSDGKSIAYMTDCGTPSVSDPGSRLVSAARENGFPVSPIPGPSALTALASVTGFSGKMILLAGFLSKKEGRRRSELESLKEFHGTIIIYESPHRILKTINSIEAVFPNRRIILGREMTKMFEEFISGTTTELSHNNSLIRQKGEFAIAINNTDDNQEPEDDEIDNDHNG
jgi:16S rRNA (cytidine1402-2'-O)-methyltransferase